MIKRHTFRNDNAWRYIRLLPVIAMLTQLPACAHRPATTAAAALPQPSTDVEACLERLAVTPASSGGELNAANIKIFNWNVHKTRAVKWRDDLQAFAAGADLVLFQEASLREETIAEMDSSRHWSFAPGYRKRGEVTGVMTLSGVKPLTQCSFVHSEPWLRTPKATGVTQYGLTGTDQTLVVVNVHAVNFTFGLAAYRDQFEQIRALLQRHDGPVIISGDLNTWRRKRLDVIEEMAASLGLRELEFETDHRVSVFGNKLDHIYVRGLRSLAADTTVVQTSDHNPMYAILGM